MTKLIIFDLDGTLLNTLDDLANCTNYVLQKNGFPTHKIDAYKYFVGNGVEMLIQRALPKETSTEIYAKVFSDFMGYYELHKADKTAPYPGMIETLEKLQEKGILLAVATNKPHELLPDLMRFYFSTIKWAAIFGNRKGVQIKPNSQIVYDILDATDCRDVARNAPADILYVGDTAVDMETAQNAGLPKVGVLWGFRTKEELVQSHADYIIEQPHELLTIISD